MGWFRENSAVIFSDSSLPSFAEIYLSVGLPGESLMIINKKLIIRKSVRAEVKKRVMSVFAIDDFIF